MIFHIYNIMTGNNFSTEIFGSYSMAWLGMVVLFFMVVFSRKWIGEAMDLPFSTIGAFVGAYLPYLIIITIWGSPKFSLLGGIIGFIVGAFLLGGLFGDSGDY
ncbi:MAG: hypothetical protein ACHQ1D_01040 [Nitrososphaerales archaeon]